MQLRNSNQAKIEIIFTSKNRAANHLDDLVHLYNLQRILICIILLLHCDKFGVVKFVSLTPNRVNATQ